MTDQWAPTPAAVAAGRTQFAGLVGSGRWTASIWCAFATPTACQSDRMRGEASKQLRRPEVWILLVIGTLLIAVGLMIMSLPSGRGIGAVPLIVGAGVFGMAIATIVRGG